MDTETAAVFAEAGVRLRQFIPVSLENSVITKETNINAACQWVDPFGETESLLISEWVCGRTGNRQLGEFLNRLHL